MSDNKHLTQNENITPKEKAAPCSKIAANSECLQGSKQGNPTTAGQKYPENSGEALTLLDGAKHSFTVDAGIDPLIPEGVYTCKLVEWQTVRMPMFCKAEKLILTFSIAELGSEYMGIKLRAFYNVTLKGKAGRWGNFKAPRRGYFMIDFCNCFPTLPLKRLDRIPMSYLQKSLIRVKVETVTMTHAQEKLPAALQYSIGKRMEGVVLT